KTARGPSFGDQAIRAGIIQSHQMAGAGDEIGEGVGLLLALAVIIPGPALVLAAADMGDGIDEAAIDERKRVRAESGRNGDAIGAIAVEQAGGRAVEREIAAVDE